MIGPKALDTWRSRLAQLGAIPVVGESADPFVRGVVLCRGQRRLEYSVLGSKHNVGQLIPSRLERLIDVASKNIEQSFTGSSE